MKKLFIMGFFSALLTGCDYTVPLVEKPTLPMNAGLAGSWHKTDQDADNRVLLILPLDETEFLVAFPYGAKDALFARACLWNDGETTLAQLSWFGTALGQTPDEGPTYQYAAYSLEDDLLTVRFLNAAAVGKEVTSTDALAKAIADSAGHPNRFREAMVFRREGVNSGQNATVGSVSLE